MKKIAIILVAAVGSFVLAFGGAWVLIKPAPAPQQAVANSEMQGSLTTSGTAKQITTKSIAEMKLKSLIEDVKSKSDEYEGMLEELKSRDERLKLTQDLVKNDIEELNKLRIELASTLSQIRSEQKKLEESLIKISEVEKANLSTLAATYDKMDPTSASKIIANMIQMQNSSAATWDDATKIVHFMGDRAKAKLLSEMVNSEPKLAAVLCQKLKLIEEIK